MGACGVAQEVVQRRCMHAESQDKSRGASRGCRVVLVPVAGATCHMSPPTHSLLNPEPSCVPRQGPPSHRPSRLNCIPLSSRLFISSFLPSLYTLRPVTIGQEHTRPSKPTRTPARAPSPSLPDSDRHLARPLPRSPLVPMPGSESYLVVGGCGFLGRHIVEQLLARGETQVSVFDIVQRHFDS